MNLRLEFVKGQGAVIVGRGQAKAMLHQHLLAGAVPGIHGANLGQCYMGLVYHQQKVLGEIIHQGKGRLACLAPRQMPGIVFDAGAIAHLVHHF